MGILKNLVTHYHGYRRDSAHTLSGCASGFADYSGWGAPTPISSNKEDIMPLRYVDVESFPECCGLVVLSDFGGGHTYQNVSEMIKPEKLKIQLQLKEKSFSSKYGGLVATLSQPQYNKLSKTFRECGWRCLFKTYNPSSKRNIYMFYKDLNKGKPKKKAKRIFS